MKCCPLECDYRGTWIDIHRERHHYLLGEEANNDLLNVDDIKRFLTSDILCDIIARVVASCTMEVTGVRQKETKTL